MAVSYRVTDVKGVKVAHCQAGSTKCRKTNRIVL